MKHDLAEIDSAIAAQEDAKAAAAAKVKAYVQDTTEPLDERWAYFLKKKMGSTGGWIHHFESFNNEKWKQWCRNALEDRLYEYLDRYREVTMFELDESLSELLNEEKVFTLDGPTYETRSEKRKVQFTKEDYDAWREEVLKDFMWSFTFDW